jgi:diacylglycerol kinase (ATP)
MKKLALIGNPKAGKGETQRHLSDAKIALRSRELQIFVPASALEVTQVCQTLDPSEFEAAIVLGGDGTQNRALRGLLQSRVPLIPFPSGTANDLSRELGITSNWSQILKLIEDGCISEIDVVEVEGIPYATVAGIGVGATLTDDFNRLRAESPLFRLASRIFGDEIYTLMTAKTLFFSPSCVRRLRLHTADFERTIDTASIFVSNQEMLGGNMRVAPPQDNADQIIHVLILPGKSAIALLRCLFHLKKGNLHPEFVSFPATEVTIENLDGRAMRVFGDGETLTESPKLHFKVRPRALKVFRTVRT